ncbi:MFS transporter, partial [Klebsiella pneumoniae]|nr:MFS transporter [Klebsiella pneumoniae]
LIALPRRPAHAQRALRARSAIGFDPGLQSSLVAQQNLVYGLEPQARGRLNALLFTVVLIGMSLGSVQGSKLYVQDGWNG